MKHTQVQNTKEEPTNIATVNQIIDLPVTYSVPGPGPGPGPLEKANPRPLEKVDPITKFIV